MCLAARPLLAALPVPARLPCLCLPAVNMSDCRACVRLLGQCLAAVPCEPLCVPRGNTSAPKDITSALFARTEKRQRHCSGMDIGCEAGEAGEAGDAELD